MATAIIRRLIQAVFVILAMTILVFIGVNVIGNPALVVPSGFDDEGMPLSVQFAGRAFDEATVYRVGYAYEQATRWFEKHPPVDA